MAVVMLHVSLAWFIITALVTWNIELVVPLWASALTTVVAIHVQTHVLRAITALALGNRAVCDEEALNRDVNPLSMVLWMVVGCVYMIHFEYAPRYLILLALLRLSRVPVVRMCTGHSTTAFSRLRVVGFAVAVAFGLLLATAYWLSDPYVHAGQMVLRFEAACGFVTSVFELVILAWAVVGNDMLGPGGTPHPADAPMAMLEVVQAFTLLVLSGVLSSCETTMTKQGHASSSSKMEHRHDFASPSWPVQLLLLKRIWLLGTAYSRYSRCVNMLRNVPNVVLGDDAHCAICLDKLKSGKRLPCGHTFHAVCLRRWLMDSRTCPLCRRTFVNIGGMVGPPHEHPRRRGLTAEELQLFREHLDPAHRPNGNNDEAEDEVLFLLPDPWPLGGPTRHQEGRGINGGDPDRGGRFANGTLLDRVFGSPVRAVPPTIPTSQNTSRNVSRHASPTTPVASHEFPPSRPPARPGPATPVPAAATRSQAPPATPIDIARLLAPPTLTAEDMHEVRERVIQRLAAARRARVRAARRDRPVADDDETAVEDGVFRFPTRRHRPET